VNESRWNREHLTQNISKDHGPKVDRIHLNLNDCGRPGGTKTWGMESMTCETKNQERQKYLYQAVSGAGVFGEPHLTLAGAKAQVLGLRSGGDRRYGCWTDAEVERLLVLNNNARRYWRWRGGRWSFDRHFDPTAADLAKWAAAPQPQETMDE
jgi:hypothetical protein